MPKHGSRSNRAGATRFPRHAAATRTGVMALSSLWLVAGSAHAVTPLNTYFGPGLPTDNYFPQGIPGEAEQLGVTVRSRLRPDYDALGIREGAFMIRPELDEQAGYDSNVVGNVNGKGSSEIQSNAAVSINSNYSRNNIGFTAGINDTRYFDVPRFSHTDYNLSFGGGLDIGRDSLNGTVSYQNANEQPYDIGTNQTTNGTSSRAIIGTTAQGTAIGLAKPLNFSDTDFRVSYNTSIGRFVLTPNVDYQLLRFAHGDFTGVPIGSEFAYNQTLRDTNILQGGVVARYEFQPQRSAVVVVNGNYDHYIHGSNQNIGIVDSTGATILAGLDYQLSGAITLRALGGYQERFFNGNRYGNSGAPIGEADFIWNPTGLTTLTGRYGRTIEDATTNTVTGYTYDRLSLVLDHELYRNILLQGSASFENASYQGSNQQQQNYGGGVGATYLINRNVQASLSYQYIEHTFTGSGSFGEDIVLFHVKFGL